MKKIFIFLVLLLLTVTVSANAPLVVDNAGLLSDADLSALTQQLETIRKEYGVDVAVLTEPSINGSSPKDYADDYYDRNGYAPDGVLLLLAMDTRDWWVSTAGSCIPLVNYEVIGEGILSYLRDGEYYQGCCVYAKMVETAMEQPGADGEFVVDHTGQVHFQTKTTHWYDGLGICLIVGVVVGGIAVAIMASGMRSVRSKSNASAYQESGSLQLTRQEDRYLYQTVTRRAKPKDNGGSHRSSSGRSHGGGGGKF